MTNLRYLIWLMLGYGAIWLGVVMLLYGVIWLWAVIPAQMVAFALPPMSAVFLWSSMVALITIYPAAAGSLYLGRQTGQKKWLIGMAVSALAATGLIVWTVLESGETGFEEYGELVVLIVGLLIGIVLFLGVTIMGCVSALQHPITRRIGLATLAMVAIFGVFLMIMAGGSDISLGFALTALMLAGVLALSGLLASAVLGTRKVAA